MRRLSEEAWAFVQQLSELLVSSASSKWQQKPSREEKIAALLEQIKDRGEPAAVFTVARCLFEPSDRIKSAACRTICRLLLLVSPDQLIHLSDVVQSSWGWPMPDAWEKLTPQEISALLVDLESRLAILGLLSFHRNGYVRQEAVRLLAREKTGEELSYLLIRQNDWVSVVGEEAQAAVNERLVPSYLSHFVRCLPLVVHLLSFRRRDLSLVVCKVVEMLALPSHDAMLAQIISRSGLPVSRQVVRAAFEIPGEHHARVIHHGMSSADAVIRLTCAKRMDQSLSGRDPFLSKVPSEELFAIAKDVQSEQARRCAVQLLFDKGKWQSLPWLIRVASLADEPIAALARELTQAWFSPPLCNRVFTKPTATEREAIDEAMEALRGTTNDMLFAKLQGWLSAV